MDLEEASALAATGDVWYAPTLIDTLIGYNQYNKYYVHRVVIDIGRVLKFIAPIIHWAYSFDVPQIWGTSTDLIQIAGCYINYC